MSTLPLFPQLNDPPTASGAPDVIASFDYTQFPADVAEEARQTAERVRHRERAQRDHIIEIGRDLLRIKERLGRGAFGPWITAEFSMTDRTAQNYMRAAKEFASKPEIVSYLPPVTVYALAAKSTPDDIRADVIAKFEAGHRLDAREIDARIIEARRTKREEQERAVRMRKRAKLSPEEQAKAGQAEARKAKRQEAQDAERRRSREERERAAEDAAIMLAERLGAGDRARLLELLEIANPYDVVGALKTLNLADGDVAGVADAPIEYVPKQQVH